MKRIAYSFLLFFALLPTCGFTQGRVMWGFNLGLDISYRHRASYMTGEVGSILCGFEIGYFDWKKFSVSAQIFLINKGYSTETNFDGSFDFFHGYLEISPALKIPFIERNLYAFAGPTVGIPLSQSSPFDCGIYGGLGFSRSLSNNVDINMQIGYAYGLQNLDNTSYYSRELRLYIGILIGK